MVLYANGFSLTTDEHRSEVIFRFVQSFPNGEADKSAEITPIAEIIMPGKLSAELCEKLHGLLFETE